MKKKLTILLLLFTTIVVSQSGITTFEAITETRTVNKGKSTRILGHIYYSVTQKKLHYLTESPVKTLLWLDNRGELTIYNPKVNEVYIQNNPMYSLVSQQIVLFLENKRTDLNLRDLGFTLTSTKNEDGLMITKWLAPMMISKDISTAELVHKKGSPIYLSFSNPKGKKIKKVYFYDFVQLMGVSVPGAVTQIDFTEQNDSIVSKTTYKNMLSNNAVIENLVKVNYPSTAKVIK